MRDPLMVANVACTVQEWKDHQWSYHAWSETSSGQCSATATSPASVMRLQPLFDTGAGGTKLSEHLAPPPWSVDQRPTDHRKQNMTVPDV